MTSRRRLALLAVLLLPALAVAVLPEPAGAEVGGAVTKLTRAEGGGNATGASSSPAVSSDGRVVAYLSDATDLVEEQPDTPGVYATVLDPETRTVRLADAPSRPGACGPLPRPAVSADGTTVAFATDDPDLVEGDENGVEDVFVVELATEETVERVSVAATGGDADGPSCAPALSADGSVVVFDSAATDLVADDADGQVDVFVRDRTAGGAEGATRLVSGDLDGAALEPDLSDDGSRAVLEVLDGEVSEVVLADLDSETTTSLTSGADGDSFDATISGDGSTVAFATDATGLVGDDTNGRTDVVVTDVATGERTRASLTDDGAEADDDSGEPSLDDDGDVVAFSTFAVLSAADVNGAFPDVAVRDLVAGRTRTASTRPGDGRTGARGSSDQPALTADGLSVAFTSDADQLVVGDTEVADVFLRRLPAVPAPSRSPTASASASPSPPNRPPPSPSTPNPPPPVPTDESESPAVASTPARTSGPSAPPSAAPTMSPPSSEEGASPSPPPTTSQPAAPGVERVGGASRLETAALVSREAFPDGSDAVLLARADTYPDALAGAPLAAQLDAPILLTPPDELATATAAEVRRLGVEQVVLLGGPAALDAGVADAVRALGVPVVERVAGDDRFATAVAIADRLPAGPAYVVEGANPEPSRGWPDALAVAPLAAAQGRPVLLATRESLPEATRRAVENRPAVTVVGGSAALDATVEAALRAIVGDVERVAGATRFETAARVAGLGADLRGPRFPLTLASGASFADALVAGPVVAREGGALLLAPTGALDEAPVLRAYLAERRDAITGVRLLGGTAALSIRVEEEVRSVLGAD